MARVSSLPPSPWLRVETVARAKLARPLCGVAKSTPLRAVADRIHSSEARVREWMTADPITATTETSVEEAGRTMLEHGFRHLPVIEGERAIGILSIRDVAQYGLQTS